MTTPPVETLSARDFEALAPGVRSDNVARHYDNEIVAWSPIRDWPVPLDPVASLVYQFLDGQTTISEIIADVHEVLEIPAAVAQAQLRRIVAMFDEAGLLTISANSELSDSELDLFLAPPNP